MRDDVRRIHFVGIGGSGMSGIAEVLVNLGYEVTGSDVAPSGATRRLEQVGAKVRIGHDAKLVEGCDVVVISSAISPDNPELAAARGAQVPVIPRAEMLADLMRLQKGVAVAGTHGKTTTTSLVAGVLAAGGLDPTFVVGGRVNSAGANAVLGQGEYLVAEADESDRSFLHLQPEIAVVTNIDADHLETYQGDFARLQDTFVEFLQNLPFYGVAVLCTDDPVVAQVAQRVHRPILTYGLEGDVDVSARDIRQDGLTMRFTVSIRDADSFEAELPLPGRHNVQNALAAVAVGYKLGVDSSSIARGLHDFQGIGRRFQLLGEVAVTGGQALVVDDYAHHPRELAATLSAARGSWPDRRLIAVFQPHRYTRTRDLLDDFSAVLADCDPLLITEVYPAGEQPIAGADGRALCRAVRARGKVSPVFVERLGELPEVLRGVSAPGDVILMLGAGDIGQLGHSLVERGLAGASA